MQAAASLANRRGAHLTLLHILRARPTPGHTDLLQGRLSAQLARTTLHGDSVPAFALRVGRKTSTIAQAAAESSADLVVLGSQARRALATLSGTTAERVVAQARRPVLVVNSDGLLQYDGIVIAADLNGTLVPLMRLAEAWGLLAAPAVVIHALESPFPVAGFSALASWEHSVKEQLLAQVEEAGARHPCLQVFVRSMRPLPAVRRALQEFARPLAILGASPHTPLSRTLKGSLLNDIVLSLRCDVLVGTASTPSEFAH